MKKQAVLFLILILLVMGMFAFEKSASAAVIPDGHVGIVISFGKAQDEALKPGWTLIAPWKSVVKMSTQWKKLYVETSAFSKDMQEVKIKMSVNYALQALGAVDMYKNVGVEYEDKIMVPLIYDAVKGTFNRYSAEELVAERNTISAEVFIELSEKLEFYDLTVKEVAIEDIDFSDAFTNAIEAKQVATQTLLQAETEQKQQTLIAEAEAERQKIKAQAAAEQKLIQAQAEADAIRVKAEAEAYRLEMEGKYITDEIIQKGMIEKWDGKLPVISGDDTTPIIDVENLMGDISE